MPRTIRQKGGVITFNVTVPENTAGLNRAVFLTGSLRQISPNLPDWDPRGLPMQRVDERHWTLTLMGQENPPNTAGATNIVVAPTIVVEYKYTLGDWDHQERGGDCADIPNRRVVVHANTSGGQTVQDTVSGWQGLNPCGD